VQGSRRFREFDNGAPERYRPRVSGELRARRWLRLDALYCAVAGALALVLSAPLARLFHLPVALPAGIGAATLVWAVLLMRFARGETWRHPLAAVATANVVASAGLAVLAAFAPAAAGRLLLIAVAAEVAAFAAVQMRLLFRA
jgi:hypothetical protein